MCSCRCPSSVTKLLHKKSRLGRVCVCARVCVESKGRILGGADDFYHLSSLMWRLCEFCGVDFFLSVLTEHSLVYLSSNWIRPSGHRRLFIRWHHWSVRFVCARMRVWVLTPLQNDACILSLLFNYHPHWERERKGTRAGEEELLIKLVRLYIFNAMLCRQVSHCGVLSSGFFFPPSLCSVWRPPTPDTICFAQLQHLNILKGTVATSN